jgi:hypothetical protein
MFAASVLAQGPLAPPGPPGETMRSLEDLWNAVGQLQAQNAALSDQLVEADQRISSPSNRLEMTCGAADAAFIWALQSVCPTWSGLYGSLVIAPLGHALIAHSASTEMFSASYAALTEVLPVP